MSCAIARGLEVQAAVDTIDSLKPPLPSSRHDNAFCVAEEVLTAPPLVYCEACEVLGSVGRLYLPKC